MKPGIYPDIDEAEYHASPELSQSQAKQLLRSPAHYRYSIDNPTPYKKTFDYGHAAHAKVLGVGAGVAVIDGNRNANAVKAKIAEARDAGLIPLKPEEADRIDQMALALHHHPAARDILAYNGQAEQSLWWEQYGVPLRARIDWLTDIAIVDYKSTADASPDGFAKSCATYGYHVQGANYTAGVEQLTGAALPFILIAQEKEPPFAVGVYNMSADTNATTKGHDRMQAACELWSTCTEANDWPAYGNDITPLYLPAWAS